MPFNVVNPPSRALLVHRRRSHLVTLSTDSLVTVAPWPLYWSNDFGVTFVCVNEVEGVGLWLPMFKLRGHWDWLTGEVERFAVVDGYGGFYPRAKYRYIRPSARSDPDTGARYWLTVR